MPFAACSPKTTPCRPSAKLQGIFTPNLVPLDSRGEINEAGTAAVRRLADRQGRARAVSQRLDRRVHAVHGGRARRIIEIICDQDARPRARFWPAPPKPTSRRRSAPARLLRARRAGRGDRRAVLLQAQPAGRVRVLQGDRATTRRSTSRSTTSRCSPARSTCRRCSGWPRNARSVVAIKDSSGDIPHMIRMIQAVRPNRPDFSFLTGWDAALMPMLLDRLRRRHERQPAASSRNSPASSTT